MRNFLKLFSVLVLASIVVISCSKKDNPTDNNLFVGSYEGSIGFVKEGENKSTNNGKVTVVKVGNNYNFVFSDGIPDLKGVQFQNEGDNAVVSIDNDETKMIRITASQLTIAYAKDGEAWTANCSR